MESLLFALVVLIIVILLIIGVHIFKTKSTGYGSEITSLISERDVLKSQLDNLTASGRQALEQAERAAQQQMEQLKENHRAKVLMLEEINRRNEETIAELKVRNEKNISELNEAHNKKISELTNNYERLLEQVRESSLKQISQLKENNDAQLKKIQEINAKQVEDQLNLIREQMKTTSEEVLRQRQNELGERNVEQVSKIINPLMDSLKGMKEAFDISKEKQKEALTRLDETIRLNTQKSESLGETADRLARALTGEVKAQGNFGELKLKQLLENMELREGEQYDTQATLKDAYGRPVTGDDGKGLIPDFILHFPNNRHVVIDAKMSLTAYERYMNAEDASEERRSALADHIQSVRSNVSRLAKKSYSRYLPEGYNRLDFAFMYVPIDAALNLALLNDNTLWKDAYDSGVIILGPQTMYMNLRVLEMMWTQVRQLENQQTMIDCANLIIERVQDFATRFSDVDSSMRLAVDKLNKFKISTASTGKSIIVAAQKLVKSGAQESKTKGKMPLKTSENIFLEADDSKLIP